MIDINNLTTRETELKELNLSALEELNLSADSEGYLKDLSEQEEINIYGGQRSVWAV